MELQPENQLLVGIRCTYIWSHDPALSRESMQFKDSHLRTASSFIPINMWRQIIQGILKIILKCNRGRGLRQRGLGVKCTSENFILKYMWLVFMVPLVFHFILSSQNNTVVLCANTYVYFEILFALLPVLVHMYEMAKDSFICNCKRVLDQCSCVVRSSISPRVFPVTTGCHYFYMLNQMKENLAV